MKKIEDIIDEPLELDPANWGEITKFETYLISQEAALKYFEKVKEIFREKDVPIEWEKMPPDFVTHIIFYYLFGPGVVFCKACENRAGYYLIYERRQSAIKLSI